MRKTVFAAAAAFAVASGATAFQAAAADLDFMPPPAPAPIFHDWTGFYVGGHVGFGEADFTARATVYDPNGGILFNEGRTLDPGGILGGVHGGYNWQAGAFVLGIEGDISFTGWDDSVGGAEIVDGREVALRAKSEVDMLASVRGRLGMAFDTLLIYGTGGIAFADGSTRFRATVDDETVLGRKFDFDDMGWVVGAGAEWAAIPNVFSVGVEGLYYIFEDRKTRFYDVDLPDVDPGTEVRLTSKFHDAWVIRGRANFHF